MKVNSRQPCAGEVNIDEAGVANLSVTTRKPFDVLVEGRLLKTSGEGGNKTPRFSQPSIKSTITCKLIFCKSLRLSSHRRLARDITGC